jgi:hypothetical protein
VSAPSSYHDAETGRVFYSRGSYVNAVSTRTRLRRKAIKKERERLLRLGADPAWLERMLGREGDA